MGSDKKTIILSPSRNIPFAQLILSQSNVRRVKSGVSIEELAEDIARRRLLRSLSFRPVVEEAGAETGMLAIPAVAGAIGVNVSLTSSLTAGRTS